MADALRVRHRRADMSGYRTERDGIDRSRVVSILAVVAIHLALGFALLRGLGVEVPHVVEQSLTLLNVPPPPPPPPEHVAPEHRVSPRKEGAASPPNLRAKATEVVAPIPILPPHQPPPVAAAPIAGVGAAPTAGAAPVIGPGFGSGGIGNGTGSGGSGNGDGGGGGTPLRLISDHVRFPSDIPYRGIDREIVKLVFTVGVKGRVTACRVTVPSGNGPLDRVVCDSIARGLRYRPELDASGRPVPVEVDGEQTWESYRREQSDDDGR